MTQPSDQPDDEARGFLGELTNLWHPVAAADKVPQFHVYHGQLLGQELAIWRAEDDYINVWENRCLHRGVRLTIAQNDGRELKCQYHGWRYANRTAACTYIPAHPANAPARTITNRTFPTRVASGLVWSSIGEPVGEPPAVPSGLVARPMPVAAKPIDVLQVLLTSPPQVAGQDRAATQQGALGVNVPGVAVFFVQPVDGGRSIIRTVLDPALPVHSARGRLALFRAVDTELTGIRRRAEELTGLGPEPERLSPRYEPVPAEISSIPSAGEYREFPTRVRVVSARETAPGIRAFELTSTTDVPLPSGQPGSHIDVMLPNGLVRQYSLINGPGETGSYVIAVRRTPDSTGGSRALHESVRTGDVLAVSLPRNNFPLRQDHERTILIAGGIGLTPLLSMAQTLQYHGLGAELHYFVTHAEDVAFQERLDQLDGVHIRSGLNPTATEAELRAILGRTERERTQLYICGPPPMLDAMRAIARETGWASENVHFEYFRNDRPVDDSSRFEIVLSRSVMNLTVEPGATILETVRAAGVSVASSCEQGACGTCRVTVIGGEPDHQDVYLDDEEKAAGRSLMTCVSRSLSPTLTLDL
ncbi:Rieske 2Fe-2S domain-containing protein [Ruania zhangjianzhongii]|uniref:Rieske 2Fe-2S domain-containing protein n=1 Tax=Ruania zhangjianzhongii TaxID=2603206 RepID=UPI0011CC2C6B|nr:Rieske 2Fe-2S domain-containing protein [Ruania zhangjianzhongii]